MRIEEIEQKLRELAGAEGWPGLERALNLFGLLATSNPGGRREARYLRAVCLALVRLIVELADRFLAAQRRIQDLEDAVERHETRLDNLTAAGQALVARVTALESGLIALEARVTALEAG